MAEAEESEACYECLMEGVAKCSFGTLCSVFDGVVGRPDKIERFCVWKLVYKNTEKATIVVQAELYRVPVKSFRFGCISVCETKRKWTVRVDGLPESGVPPGTSVRRIQTYSSTGNIRLFLTGLGFKLSHQFLEEGWILGQGGIDARLLQCKKILSPDPYSAVGALDPGPWLVNVGSIATSSQIPDACSDVIKFCSLLSPEIAWNVEE